MLAGEVGTIVLGVLIALGAQDFVQSLHWNREVRETRKALDAELARDLAVFEQRYRNRGCVADRLAEISHWADSLFAGKPPRLKHDIEEPPFFLVRTAAWEVTTQSGRGCGPRQSGSTLSQVDQRWPSPTSS